jgi:diguanylate cyclase (GGDEF)-like protein
MARRFASSFELLLFALGLLTGAAVLGQRRLLERSLVVVPGPRFAVDVSGDALAGGRSVARWTDRGAQRWECEIRPGFQYPFCSYQVSTGGIDLTDYTHLRLWLRYEGGSSTVRVFLRNWNPAYSQAGDTNTLKFNQVEVQARELGYPASIALADFQVASWWLLEHRIPLEQSKPEFGSVAIIEVQTGTGAAPGVHRFEISRVEFVGQRLSTERLYLCLLVLWLGVILLDLLRRVWGLRGEVEERRARERELEQLNRLLNVESREFEAQARSDPLTGAANRAGIRELLRAGARAWEEDRRPLSIVAIDLDDFKLVNDSCGHEAGDAVLVALARLVRGRIRSSDTLARWGGDEFVVVCRDTALQDAAALARNLREALERNPLHESYRVSASFGVASLGEESIADLFRRADEALYEAKRTGRNLVVVSPTPARAARPGRAG